MKNAFFRSRIAGTGSYLPEKVLTNHDLEQMVDTNDAWIVERTGIRRRHFAADNQATSDMALIAAQQALNAAGLSPQDIDLILFATVTADYQMPSAACVLQKKLGAPPVMAFDLNAACTGFLYGLTIADQFIKTGTHKNILICGAETLHRFINYKDRETCILFGDGAGAFVLTRANDIDDCGVLGAQLRADGNLADLLILPAGGSVMPASHETVDKDLHFVHMKGREIFKNAVRAMSSACQDVLESSQTPIEKVDWLVPHQANLRIIQAVGEYFGIPSEKVIVTIDETGNTSAATIPIALDQAIRDGRVKRGQNLMMTAFGAGLTSGSVLVRY